MNEITAIRTPEIIAAEINSIKNQTQKIMLQASIEIGRRLTEAKAAVGHGNWGEWLKASVDYSERTASNLMRIFGEYGSGQEKLFGSSNQQAFAELNYTQAIALLGIRDEDERAEFIEKNDIDSMSTRELQEAIKERDQAKAETERLSQDLRAAENSKKQFLETAKILSDKATEIKAEKEEIEARLTAERNEERQRAAKLERQLAEAKPEDKGKIAQLKKDLAEQKAKVKELNDRLAEPIEAAVVEKVPEETELELKALHEQVEKLQAANGQDKAAIAVRTYLGIVQNDTNKLLEALGKIEDPATQAKYRAAAGKMIDVIRAQFGVQG